MSAADDPKRSEGRGPVRVKMRESGETVTLPYRKAVGLISTRRADWATPTKKAKK